MRVLSAAEPDKWEMTSRCGACGTSVAVGVADLAMLDDQLEGRSFRWICPTCHGNQWIRGEDVPRVLHFAIKQWVP